MRDGDGIAAEGIGAAREARLRESFATQGLMRHLGVEMVALRRGEAVLRLPFRRELTQHHGYFHGGATSALADTAGGYAGCSVLPQGMTVLTVEFKLNLLSPGQGDFLEAAGRVIRPGRTLIVCQLDVWSAGRGERKHVATGMQTLMAVPDRPAAG